MTKPPQREMLIGDLAKLASVKSDTIRFYEKRGLLAAPQRKASGYRVYDEAALRQVRFIKRAQALGFTLDEIQRILNLRGQGRPTCRCVIAMAEATLSETEDKLQEMLRFADGLRKNLARWRKASGSGKKMAAEFCALIESTSPR
jgi:MerR family transcriptional regulator, copper efflux regulator